MHDDVIHIGREDIVKMMRALEEEQESSYYSNEVEALAHEFLSKLEPILDFETFDDASATFGNFMETLSEDVFFNGFCAALQMEKTLDGMRKDYIEGLNRRMSKEAPESPTSVSTAKTSSNT